MNRRQWQEIEQARDLLGLGERATVREIKRAYRHQCKLHHPDTAQSRAADTEELMYRITAAYELLMRYCSEFPIPLAPEEGEEPDLYDPEEWWQARFGQDPLWSGKKGRRR